MRELFTIKINGKKYHLIRWHGKPRVENGFIWAHTDESPFLTHLPIESLPF